MGAPISVGSFNSPMMPHEQYSQLGGDRKSAGGQGFGVMDTTSQSTFKKRTASVSKPVDRDTMDSFRQLVDNCGQSDWQKRLRAIDEI